MKILITGCCGMIGGAVYRRVSDQPDSYDVHGTDRRTEVREKLPDQYIPRINPHTFLKGDLADFEFAKQAVKGMDTVVHMAANANPHSTFENILNCNLISTYNIFEACRIGKVKRIIFASSIRVSLGYYSIEPYKSMREGRFCDVPDNFPIITADQQVWPVEPYGASKVWGEALGRAYNQTHGISCFCIRIGAASPAHPEKELIHENKPIWVSLTDISALIHCCIDSPLSLGFDIFYGISDNKYRWIDIKNARKQVNYIPLHSYKYNE